MFGLQRPTVAATAPWMMARPGDAAISSAPLTFPAIPDGRACGSVVPWTSQMGPKDNQPTLATVMVSHHWRNLFCDLIAAIVAFALGDTSYEAVAAELHEHKFEELRLRLDRRDALEMSFWGCLFCVNQHAGICGSFAPEPLPDQKDYKVAHAEWTQNTRDPVTGEAFPICRCTHAKNWNDSNDCEMDKFDAMMAVLHEEAPRVAQRCHHMIVVDRHFEVFSRICVMAEIAKGQELELTQHAMLFSGVDELLDSEVGSWVCAGGGGGICGRSGWRRHVAERGAPTRTTSR